MLEDLSTKDLRTIEDLCHNWVLRNGDLTIAEACPDELDILVTYNKVRRLLVERSDHPNSKSNLEKKS